MIVKHSSDETPKPMPVGLRLARVVSIGNGTVDVCPIGSSVVLHDIPVTSATTMQVGDVINLQMMDNKRFAFAQQNVTSASESSEKTVTIVNAAAEGGGGGSGSTGTLTVSSGLSVNPTSSGNLGGAVSLALDASVARNTWTVAAGNGLTGGGFLSSAGIALNVGQGDGIAVSGDAVAVDGTVVRITRQITAGNGLSGTSTLASDVTLNVVPGNGISVAGDAVSAVANAAKGIAIDGSGIAIDLSGVSGLEFSSGKLQIDDNVAGNGLVIASKVISVGAGDGIASAANSISVFPNSSKGIAVDLFGVAVDLSLTSGLEFSSGKLQVRDDIAADGLIISSKKISVGKGDGIFVDTNEIRVVAKNNGGLVVDAGGIYVNEGDGISVSEKVRAKENQLKGIFVNGDGIAINLAPSSGMNFGSQQVEPLSYGKLRVGQGDGILVGESSVSAVGNANKSVVVESAGIGVKAHEALGIKADLDGVGIKKKLKSSGLKFDSNDQNRLTIELSSVSGLRFEADGEGASNGLEIDDNIAGDGLRITDKVLFVGQGEGLKVTSNAVEVYLSEYSGLTFVGDPGDRKLTIDDKIAGPGLGVESNASENQKVLSVGTATQIHSSAPQELINGVWTNVQGLITRTNDVKLHASSNPGASSHILASDAEGRLTLPIFLATDNVNTNLIVSPSGQALTLRPTMDVVLDPQGSGRVVLNAGKSFQSSSFASQNTGMRITSSGEADFRYLYTSEMHAKSFIVDLEQALAGGQIISKAVAILSGDFLLPDAGASGEMTVLDLPSAIGMPLFQEGDTVGMRKFSRFSGWLDIGWAWGVVTNYAIAANDSQGRSRQKWTFTRLAGAASGAATGTIEDGALVLDFGVSGNGWHEVNAIDGQNGSNSPYSQIATWTTYPGDSKVRARFGNLKGIFNNGNEYGLYAGSGPGPEDKYFRASDKGFELSNIPIRMFSYDASTSSSSETLRISVSDPNVQNGPTRPTFAMGSPLPTAPFGDVGSGIWMGLHNGSYQFRVGQTSATELVKGIMWDGVDLTVKGHLVAKSGFIEGVLGIGLSGGIWQGTGTFSEPKTGLKIYSKEVGSDRVGSIEGWKETNGVGVRQWWADSDGILKAGADISGNETVTLSRDGVTVKTTVTTTGSKPTGIFGINAAATFAAARSGYRFTYDPGYTEYLGLYAVSNNVADDLKSFTLYLNNDSVANGGSAGERKTEVSVKNGSEPSSIVLFSKTDSAEAVFSVKSDNLNGAGIYTNAGLNVESAPSGYNIGSGNVYVEGQVVAGGSGKGFWSAFYAESSTPSYGWSESDQSGNEKKWHAYVSGKILSFATINESEDSETVWLAAKRAAGTTIDSVYFPNGLIGIGNSNPKHALDIGIGSSAVDQSVRVISGEGKKSSLKLMKQSDNFGFSLLYDAVADVFKILRHNDDVNGANSIIINKSNGYFGIGTASVPSYLLDVAGNTRVTGGINVGTYTGSGNGDIHMSGQLGVGTDSPSGAADIRGVFRSQLTVGSTDAGNAGAIGFRRSGGMVTGYIGFASATELNEFNFSVGSGGGLFTWDINVNGAGSEEVMRISNAGNVGIGTNNPQYNLDVNGIARVSTGVNVGDAASASTGQIFAHASAGNANHKAIDIRNSSLSAGATLRSVSISMYGINEDARILAGNETSGSGNDGYLAFYTRDENSVAEKLRIDSLGNVAVVGSVRSTGWLHLRNKVNTAAYTYTDNRAAVVIGATDSNEAWYIGAFGSNTRASSDSRLQIYGWGVSGGAKALMLFDHTVSGGVVDVEARLDVASGLNVGSASGATTGQVRALELYLGSASDVRLYRSAADMLRTPDSVTVDAGLNVGSATGATTGQIRASERIVSSRLGFAGTYSFDQVQSIWSIGDGWAISTTNNDFGSLYGIGYAYGARGATSGKRSVFTEHQIVFADNGNVRAAISLTDGNAMFGSTAIDYTPTTSNWNGGRDGSTLLLNGANYTTIGFHDSGNRVDYIRVGAGKMVLGYNAGWGAPFVYAPGGFTTSSSSLSAGGIIRREENFRPAWLSNQEVDDSSAIVVTVYTYGAQWANLESTEATWNGLQVKAFGDFVFLRGLVTRSSGSNAIIATLGTSWRPSKRQMFWCGSSIGMLRIDLNTNGNLELITSVASGAIGWISLYGIVYGIKNRDTD